MQKSEKKLPTIVLTGASGFIGRYFLNRFKDKYTIFALARRTQKTANVSPHPNIKWIRIDITDQSNVAKVFKRIAKSGKVDYVFHLAAFFSFDSKNHPEYYSINFLGTRNIILNSIKLKPDHFIFMSSISVTDFSRSNTIISEQSPADGQIPYSKSKGEAEKLVKEYASEIPSIIVRPTVIYSDWCEYLPLYCYLMSWSHNKWNHRMIPGSTGVSGFPLLHINDLLSFFQALLNCKKLGTSLETFVVSPKHSASQYSLFNTLADYNYFNSIKPIFLPKWLAYIGIYLLKIQTCLLKKIPFEQPWLLKYVDNKMIVNSDYTQKLLNWKPTPRFTIERRLLFLIDKMRNHPLEWRYKNEVYPFHAIIESKYIKIYENLINLQDKIIYNTVNKLLSKHNAKVFPSYQMLSKNELTRRVKYICAMLEDDLRTGERSNVLNYAERLGEERHKENFPLEEVTKAIRLTADEIMKTLLSHPELNDIKQKIHDEIMLSFRMAIDKIQDTYDSINTSHEISVS